MTNDQRWEFSRLLCAYGEAAKKQFGLRVDDPEWWPTLNHETECARKVKEFVEGLGK